MKLVVLGGCGAMGSGIVRDLNMGEIGRGRESHRCRL